MELLKKLIENASHWQTSVPSWVPAILVFALVKFGIVTPEAAQTLSTQIIEIVALVAGVAGTLLLGPKTPSA